MSTTTFDRLGTSASRPPAWKRPNRAKRSDGDVGITTISEERMRLIEEALHYGRTGKKTGRARAARNTRRGILAIFLSLFLITGYGTYLSAFGTLDIHWGTEKNRKDPEVKSDYEIADIKIGMTLDAVKAIHPNLKIEAIEPSNIIASFERDSVKHTAWFRPVNGFNVLWKIRFSRFLADITPDQALASLANTFGLSYSSACKRSAFRPVPQCRYNWLGASGISVQAELFKIQSEPVVGAKPLGTSLTVTAHDPSVLGRPMRAENKSRDRSLRKTIDANWKQNETWIQAEANRITKSGAFADQPAPVIGK